MKTDDDAARRRRMRDLHPDHMGREQTDAERKEYTDLANGKRASGSQGNDKKKGNGKKKPEPEPGPAPDGEKLLDDVQAFIRRFCVLPDAPHALVAATLWAAHAHCVEHFFTTPRLAMLSPVLSCGKTRMLEILELLVPNPRRIFSASPAAIFRMLANTQVTLLLDEADTVWARHGKDDTHEDLRALLNSGYKRGANIPRCVGAHHEVKIFPVFAAVALAGIGFLPDTIMSRAIPIRMRRRLPSEPVEPFHGRDHEPQGHALRDRLALWAQHVGTQAGNARPKMPAGITDRPAEVWEPLLSLADCAGGHWPVDARAACVVLCKIAADRKASLAERLLADLWTIWMNAGNPIAMHSETIVQRLADGAEYGLEADAPWGDYRGKPIDQRQLASLLKLYEISSTKVKVAGAAKQGYRREDLWDAWRRYVPASSIPADAEPAEPPEPPDAAQGSTGSTGSANAGVEEGCRR